MSTTNHSNVDLLKELNGNFNEKINQALSDAGNAAVKTGKAATVTLTLKLAAYKNTTQCGLSHKIATNTPHATGKATDEDTQETSVYVHSTGKISIFQENQGELAFELKS